MPDLSQPTPTQLTREQLANLRFVECSAQLESVDSLDSLQPAESVALAAVEKAAGAPMLTNGKPTIARVVAWMCHAGVNRNRQAFVKEELQAAASTMGLPDNPLVMDFNHAAIRRPEGAQRMVGVWHKAEYAFDQKANDGQGAWGILVSGFLFSWLFPDLADQLLAEQARKGYVAFSMAAVAGTVEFGKDANGPFETLHNPAFFTNSLLDVKPGDKDARGLLTEGANDPDVEQKMMTKLCSTAAFRDAVAEAARAALKTQEEGSMDIKVNFVHVVSDAGEAKVTMTAMDGTEQVANEHYTFAVPQVAELATATAKIAELEAVVTKLADTEAALEAATANAEQLTTTLTELTTAHEALSARVAEIDAVAAAEAAKAKLAARVAELPEAFVAKHAAKAEAERTAIEARWAAKNDEEWKEFTALLADAVVPASTQVNTASYRARTLLEGIVPIMPSTTSGSSISERVHKVLHN